MQQDIFVKIFDVKIKYHDIHWMCADINFCVLLIKILQATREILCTQIAQFGQNNAEILKSFKAAFKYLCNEKQSSGDILEMYKYLCCWVICSSGSHSLCVTTMTYFSQSKATKNLQKLLVVIIASLLNTLARGTSLPISQWATKSTLQTKMCGH